MIEGALHSGGISSDSTKIEVLSRGVIQCRDSFITFTTAERAQLLRVGTILQTTFANAVD